MFKTKSSINNEICFECKLNTNDDLNDIIYNYKQNFNIWKNVELNQRIELIKNLLNNFYKKKNIIIARLVTESAKPISLSINEFELFKKKADEIINNSKKYLEPLEHNSILLKRIPIGICLIMNSWNYPLQIIANVIFPCLIAGNCVIFNSSKQIPSIGKILKESFDETIGENHNLLNFIFNNIAIDNDNLDFLLSHNDISYIHYSGNKKEAKEIVKKSCQNGILKHITLELDGKNAAYVAEDANLKLSAKEICKSCFYNSGQNGSSIERVYVHKNVCDLFIHYLKQEAENIIFGDPFDENVNMGPITNSCDVKMIKNMIQKSRAIGATQILNQLHYKNAIKNGNYIPPQILLEVGHNMEIMNEKIYAPVMCVMCVRNDEDGIKCINECNINISSSIWTENIDKGKSLSNKTKSRFTFLNKCEYIDTMNYLNEIDNLKSNNPFEYCGYYSFTKLQSVYT